MHNSVSCIFQTNSHTLWRTRAHTAEGLPRNRTGGISHGAFNLLIRMNFSPIFDSFVVYFLSIHRKYLLFHCSPPSSFSSAGMSKYVTRRIGAFTNQFTRKLHALFFFFSSPKFYFRKIIIITKFNEFYNCFDSV